jgi:hypothetical protein
MKRIFTLKSVVIAALSIIFILQSCGISEKKQTTLETGRNELSERYCMPELVDKTWYSSNKKAPLFKGLDGIDFQITTQSEEAKLYFSQA